MGMSTYVIGFKPPDEKWQAMFKIYVACSEAGIKLPTEVDKFFEGEIPDRNGVKVDLITSGLASRYRGDSKDGIEVDIRKLPEDVTIIRFVNSY